MPAGRASDYLDCLVGFLINERRGADDAQTTSCPADWTNPCGRSLNPARTSQVAHPYRSNELLVEFPACDSLVRPCSLLVAPASTAETHLEPD
jgi:hypothetical protein